MRASFSRSLNLILLSGVQKAVLFAVENKASQSTSGKSTGVDVDAVWSEYRATPPECARE